MESMLQAPAFLFWMQEAPRPEWKPYATASGSPTSCGTRCRTMRCSTAAAKGELDTPQGVERIARQMLTDPKARTALDEFVSQWLRFDRALGAARERRTFPSSAANWCFRCSKNPDASSATWFGTTRTSWTCSGRRTDSSTPTWPPYIRFRRRLAISIASISRPIRNAPGFLARRYSSRLPASRKTPRHVARPIHSRTVSVPAGASAPSGRGYQPSAGQRVSARHQPGTACGTRRPIQACASCHSLIDPLGFGLEKFDAIGVRREKTKLLFYPDVHEAKIPKKTVELDLDITGQVAGLENSEFTNSRQMGEILAGSAQCQECVVRQMFRYMAGRRDTPADAPRDPRRVLDEFRRSGFQFQQLLVSLVRAGGSLQARVGKESRWRTRSRNAPDCPGGYFSRACRRRNRPSMVGLPPLVSMFNSHGTAYAAADANETAMPVEKRFVLWFNGNGIPERYWIPDQTGADYDMTPCLVPLARLRNDVHVISGLDNSAIVNTAFDGHSTAMSALMTCTRYLRARTQRSLARPDRGAAFPIGEPVPFAADRRVAGVVRWRDAEEHELGRTGPRAAARGDSAPLCSIAYSAPRKKAGCAVNVASSIRFARRPTCCAPVCRRKIPSGSTSTFPPCATSSARSRLCRPSIGTCRNPARTSI